MKFSLILATYGLHKIEAIKKFISGLRTQNYSDLELIVVDQNPEYDLKRIFDEVSDFLKVYYIRSGVKSLSHARNIGIRKATGDVIAFPDDDCFYPKGLIANVFQFFNKNKNIDLLSIDCRDIETMDKLSFISLNKSRDFDAFNVFKAVTSISIFLRTRDGIPYFDERFGLGGLYNSAEEFDFATTYLLKKRKAYYDSTIHVLHPNNNNMIPRELIRKVKRNSVGHGAYLRKYFPNTYFASFKILLLKPILGIAVYFLTLNFFKCRISFLSLVFRVKGFIKYSSH